MTVLDDIEIIDEICQWISPPELLVTEVLASSEK
jgi:hypothetical protein